MGIGERGSLSGVEDRCWESDRLAGRSGSSNPSKASAKIFPMSDIGLLMVSPVR